MKTAFLVLVLYFPELAIARGTLFDFQSLFIFFLGICFVVGVAYFIFAAPSQIINKLSNKNSNDNSGYSIWFISLWTLFVPFLFLSFFEIKINTIIVVIVWVGLIGVYFVRLNSQSEKNQNKKNINKNEIKTNNNKIQNSKPNYEWQLTEKGIVNLKNGNLIPKNYLRQIDQPEPGCLIDNYLLKTEFIPEYKINLNLTTTNLIKDDKINQSDKFSKDKISSLMTQFKTDRQSAIDMINLKISYQNDLFIYKNYRYEKLKDAIAYAKLDNTKN